MSLPQVIKTRDWLCENGWIKKGQRANKSLKITLIDRMAENVARYTSVKDIEQSVEQDGSDQNIEHDDQNIDRGDQNPANKEEPNKNNQQETHSLSSAGAEESRFSVGQRVVWAHEMRGGYGYIEYLDAVVTKITAKRVSVAVAKKDGETVTRSVKAEKLYASREDAERAIAGLKKLEELSPHQRVIAQRCLGMQPGQRVTAQAAKRANTLLSELRDEMRETTPDADTLDKALEAHISAGFAAPGSGLKMAGIVKRYAQQAQPAPLRTPSTTPPSEDVSADPGDFLQLKEVKAA